MYIPRIVRAFWITLTIVSLVVHTSMYTADSEHCNSLRQYYEHFGSEIIDISIYSAEFRATCIHR